MVVSLIRRIHSTKEGPARFLDKQVGISFEIRIPTSNGHKLTYRLVATIQHLDRGQTGQSGHFVSHLYHEGQFYKKDTDKPLMKSTAEEIQKSTHFLYMQM